MLSINPVFIIYSAISTNFHLINLGGGTPKVAVELLTPGSGNTRNSVYIEVYSVYFLNFVCFYFQKKTVMRNNP